MKKKRLVELTRHHIIPKSRGGDSREENIKRIPYNEHMTYHQLFSNLTPEEIVVYLNDHFWKRNYEIEVRKR